MTDQEILEKAILKSIANSKKIITKAVQKAVDNGWRPMFIAYPADKPFPMSYKEYAEYLYNYERRYEVIFDHSFAKALWGEDMSLADGTVVHQAPATWKPKLMEMVIADDPIKYLGENI